MSLNKTQLEQVNQSNFPNNNQQLITPEKLREFNTDMIEAMVINDATASFAKTNVSNTFTANQTINGNLTVTGTISASVIHTQIETASVIYSSGSNQFGDELTDVQTLSGSVRIQGNLLVNGLPIFTGSVNTDGLVTTSSFNAYTASTNAEISALEANTASVNASITNINSFTQSANVSISALNAFTQSQAALNGTFATTGSNTFTGNQIIDRASKLYTNGIYWTDVTAGYNNLEIINQGGGNLDFASLNGGKVRFVSSSVNFLNSAISSSNDISTSANIYAANLTGSTINTGSLLVTASAAGANITFTKGDASQFTITVATGSFVSASYAETSSITRNVVVVARNNNASTLGAGTVVHITGASGDNPIFTTASYDNEALSSNTFGLLRYSSAPGADVEVVVNGVVTGVNTNPALGYAAGDILYLSSSGQFTNVQPQAPNQIVTLGQVLRAQQNNGSIYVSINNGWELNELHNVQITNPLTGDLLQYESSSYGLWKNKSISGAGIATTASFNAYTSSTNVRLNNIEAATSSYITEAESGSFLITASFDNGTRDLTFTKGDASTFSVNIPDVSGSALDTGSFATTGSNSFNGNQTITGSFIVDYSGGNPELVIDSITNDITLRKTAGANPLQIISPTSGVSIESIETTIGDTANALYPSTSGNQNQLKTTKINGSFTASLQEGYVWVGDSTNTSVLVATSSFGGTIPDGRFATLGANTFTGSQTITAAGGLTLAAAGGGNTNFAMSGSQTNITLTAPNNFFNVGGLFNFNNNYANGGSGSLQFSAVSSSVQFYATNGVIIGQAFVTGGPAGNGFVNMNTTSGSLSLAPSGFNNTLASLSHLSASSNSNNVNLLFKNSNTAASTILSGSANIFSNPAAPTAGFVRYMTGGNIAVGGSGAAVPQISASMAWSPTIANNVFANSTTPITFRGPVSSSASTINNNVLAGGTLILGTAAATDFGRATAGTSINGNVINGTINAFAYKTPLTTTITLTNNNIGGAANINADSSSLGIAGNTIQVASLQINNSYSSSVSAPNNLLQLGPGNGMFGQNILIYASGSNTSVTPRGIYANLISGIFVTASVNLNGDNSALSSTTIAGHGLSVTGSATHFVGTPTRNSTHGSAFFGRFNAEDGNKAKTAETIFAVGTGTTSAAKTGFLIDSGSNTFVEGSLNVSGSSRFNGAVNVTGSLVANKLSCYDFDSLYYGSQMGGTTANGTFFGYGSTSYSWIMGAYAGGFDNELQFYTDSSGVYFNDFNGAGYTTFLKLSPNPGTNPAPIMTRGLIVTGSMNVSGSITAVTFGAQGNVITNATPVSSSLQPTLNIVTLTSAEYALITPNSQTLYVIV